MFRTTSSWVATMGLVAGMLAAPAARADAPGSPTSVEPRPATPQQPKTATPRGPTAATLADPEVVWLRKRVEQLEGQLASAAHCPGAPGAGQGVQGQPTEQGQPPGAGRSLMQGQQPGVEPLPPPPGATPTPTPTPTPVVPRQAPPLSPPPSETPPGFER